MALQLEAAGLGQVGVQRLALQLPAAVALQPAGVQVLLLGRQQQGQVGVVQVLQPAVVQAPQQEVVVQPWVQPQGEAVLLVVEWALVLVVAVPPQLVQVQALLLVVGGLELLVVAEVVWVLQLVVAVVRAQQVLVVAVLLQLGPQALLLVGEAQLVLLLVQAAVEPLAALVAGQGVAGKPFCRLLALLLLKRPAHAFVEGGACAQG